MIIIWTSVASTPRAESMWTRVRRGGTERQASESQHRSTSQWTWNRATMDRCFSLERLQMDEVGGPGGCGAVVPTAAALGTEMSR